MIQEIQEKIYSQVWAFPAMNHDDKVKHVAILKDLLNKQQILYADPEAKIMKKNIDENAKECGFPQSVDIGNVFTNMFNAVAAMEKQLKKES